MSEDHVRREKNEMGLSEMEDERGRSLLDKLWSP